MKKYKFLIAAIIFFVLAFFCGSLIGSDDIPFHGLKMANWILTGGDIITTRIGLANPNIYEKNHFLPIPIKLGQVYLTNKAVTWIFNQNKFLGYITIGIIDILGAWAVYHNIRTLTRG